MSASSNFEMSSFLYYAIISCFCREVIKNCPGDITAYVRQRLICDLNVTS